MQCNLFLTITAWPQNWLSLCPIYYSLFFSFSLSAHESHHPTSSPPCWVVIWWPICGHSARATFSCLSLLCYSDMSLICIDVYLLLSLTQCKGHFLFSLYSFYRNVDPALTVGWSVEDLMLDTWMVSLLYMRKVKTMTLCFSYILEKLKKINELIGAWLW